MLPTHQPPPNGTEVHRYHLSDGIKLPPESGETATNDFVEFVMSKKSHVGKMGFHVKLKKFTSSGSICKKGQRFDSSRPPKTLITEIMR